MNIAMHSCSICGRPLGKTLPDPEAMELPRRQRLALEALVKANGRYVPVKRMIDHVYGDDEDGGPEGADGSIYSHVAKLRKRLRDCGWIIESRRFDGYRLRPAQQPTTIQRTH